MISDVVRWDEARSRVVVSPARPLPAHHLFGVPVLVFFIKRSTCLLLRL
jgi:hypothetical protein